MIVGMYMNRDVEVVSKSTSLLEAIRKLNKRQIRRLAVMNGESLVGIVCHRDLMQAYPHHVNPFSPSAMDDAISARTISTIMKHPVITVEQDQPLEVSAQLMSLNHIGALPVLHNDKLVGIITESDVFRALTQLLSGQEGSVRITFDLSKNEKVLTFLVETMHRLNLELLSFISFKDQDHPMAVARVKGTKVGELIDILWDSGHKVVNVLRSGSTG